MQQWLRSKPEVSKWLRGQTQLPVKGEVCKNFLGRTRHFSVNGHNLWHVQNEYKNTPIQGGASEFTNNSLIEINEWLHNCVPGNTKGERARIVLTVHDSIVLEVHSEDEPEWFLSWVVFNCKKIMEESPQDLVSRAGLEPLPLVLRADYEIGDAYGDLHEAEEGFLDDWIKKSS